MTTEIENGTNSQPTQFKTHPDLMRLIDLQKLDTQILRKKKLLIQLPQEIEEAYAECEKAKAALKEFDDSLQADAKKRRDLEQGVEELKEKIIKDKGKLPSVKTNVEYNAINKELANYEKKINKLEEEELLLMEEAEERHDDRSLYSNKLAEEEKSFAAIKTEKESGIKTLESDVAELITKRESTNASITPTILASYEKILNVRDGIGVARAHNSTCTACYRSIQHQLYYNIRDSGELLTCPHCSRYLYFEAEPEEAS